MRQYKISSTQKKSLSAVFFFWIKYKIVAKAYDEGAPDALDNTFRPVVSILWMIRWSRTILRFARSSMSSSMLPLATSR